MPPPPPRKKEEEEVDMDKVTAAMVLTSLSTSPLVRSPPVKVTGEHCGGGEVGFWLSVGSLVRKMKHCELQAGPFLVWDQQISLMQRFPMRPLGTHRQPVSPGAEREQRRGLSGSLRTGLGDAALMGQLEICGL